MKYSGIQILQQVEKDSNKQPFSYKIIIIIIIIIRAQWVWER